MKKTNMFKLLGTMLLFAGMVSCSEDNALIEELDNDTPVETEEKKETSFSATTEEIMEDTINTPLLPTRTILRTGNVAIWAANDAISVWMNDGMQKFVTLSGGERAVFEGLTAAMSTLSDAYALYPYDEHAALSGTTMTTVLNADQKAYENSYDIHSAVAVSQLVASEQEAGGLFRNVCSFIRFSISSEYSGEKVMSATFSGRNGEALAGDLSIDVTNIEQPVGRIIGNEKTSVTIDANGTMDGELLNDGTTYVFIILPQTLSKGFEIKLTSESGKTCTFKSSASNSFLRSGVKNLGALNPVWQNDYEDKGDHWIVYTAKGLYEWATTVNGGDFDTDKYGEGDTDLGLILANDIDLNDYIYNGAWKPVCSQEHPYEGIINGQNHTIKNMKIEGREHPMNQGFLGWIQEHSSVSNLNFETPVIVSYQKGTDDNERYDDSYVGVVVGAMNIMGDIHIYEGATISNCHVTGGSVTGGEGVGGIVGRSFATRDVITGCTYSGEVNGIMFAGGIIGSNEGFVTDCHFNGTVTFDAERSTGVGRIGGIVGSNNSAGVIGCTAQGVVNGDDERYVGGIVGVNNGPLYGCASAVTVNGEHGGAIAGVTLGTMGASYAVKASAHWGIVWWVESNGVVNNCYTTVTTVSAASNAELDGFMILENEISGYINEMNATLEDSPIASEWKFIQNDGSVVDSSVFPIIAVRQ